jgi:hypothetical protein
MDCDLRTLQYFYAVKIASSVMLLTEVQKTLTSDPIEKMLNDARSSLHAGPSGRWSPKAGLGRDAPARLRQLPAMNWQKLQPSILWSTHNFSMSAGVYIKRYWAVRVRES